MADAPSSPGAAAQQVVAQLRGLWTRLPRLGRLGAIGALALIAGAIAYASLASGPTPWEAVAGTMPAEDASELSGLLASRGLPYRVVAEGKRVEVPPARLAEARMIAVAARLPRGGVGLELMDTNGLGMSTEMEKAKYQRALQGELERSIESLAPVESAHILVARGRRSMIRETDQPPSASVTLHLRPGVTLSPDQVRGIKQVVAASVDGLDADRVAVVDQHGAILTEDADAGTAGTDATALEATLALKVRTLLETIVGPGHVAVVAAVEMDRRRVVESEVIYDASRAAVLSETLTGVLPTTTATASGIAGVQGNLGGTPGATTSAGATVGPTGSQTRNYQNTQTNRTTEQPVDKIGRVHLAILVDHRLDASGRLATLPQAELDQLAALARNAAGLDERRGDALELQSFAFAPDEQIAPPLPAIEPAAATLPIALPVPLPVAGGALAALIAFIVFALTIRGRRRRRTAAVPVLALPASLGELERALEGEPASNRLPTLAAAGQRTLEERVVGAVRGDVPRTARVLAAWLTQPDPRPAK